VTPPLPAALIPLYIRKVHLSLDRRVPIEEALYAEMKTLDRKVTRKIVKEAWNMLGVSQVKNEQGKTCLFVPDAVRVSWVWQAESDLRETRLILWRVGYVCIQAQHAVS
jgi:hypothetical protein